MVKYQEEELDRIFGALGDPSRRHWVRTLRSGEATVEQLGRPLGLSTPGVMKHLAVLERSGRIAGEKRGRSRSCRRTCYCEVVIIIPTSLTTDSR